MAQPRGALILAALFAWGLFAWLATRALGSGAPLWLGLTLAGLVAGLAVPSPRGIAAFTVGAVAAYPAAWTAGWIVFFGENFLLVVVVSFSVAWAGYAVGAIVRRGHLGGRSVP